ncbi:MAG TPA: hypothetical protein VM243_06515 [Phycisphaerae bacterium]|nr:hypothetical protein [Phycisphaerae bacterium]
MPDHPNWMPNRSIIPLLCAGAVLASCRVIHEPEPTPGQVTVRIENATGSQADVAVTIDPGTEAGATAARATFNAALTPDGTVRVPPSSFTEGVLLCGEQFVISATVGENAGTTVVFDGAGTGTPGFDEGSVGLAGERTLLNGTHFDCGDAIVIRLTDDGSRAADTEPVGTGQISVFTAGDPIPEPDLPANAIQSTNTAASATAGSTSAQDQLQVRVENGTPSDAQVTFAISDFSQSNSVGYNAAYLDDDLTTNTVVRVAGGQYSAGTIACGQKITVSADVGTGTPATVSFSGDGTGTPGFDQGSVGLSGERMLVYNEHYACGATLIVHITDDGTGVGFSESNAPLGDVQVYTELQPLPDPVLLPEGTPEDQVGVDILNQTTSPIQVRLSLGNAISDGQDTASAGAGSTQSANNIEVRVLSGDIALGTVPCSALVTVTSWVVIPKLQWGSDGDEESVEDKYREVVLTGEGTGTPGFDEGAVGTDYQRFLVLDTHFQCGDIITITITDPGASSNWPDPGSPGAGIIGVDE